MLRHISHFTYIHVGNTPIMMERKRDCGSVRLEIQGILRQSYQAGKKNERINNAPDICVQHIFIAPETNYKWKYWAIYFNVV